MKCRLLLVLLWLGSISLCWGAQCNKDYDYFELALRWPNSYCIAHQGSCRDEVPQQLIIGYLRPVKRSDPGLQYCPTSYDLSDDLLRNYKIELQKLWPDLTTDNFDQTEAMLRDQWNMYGSCSDCILNPEQYIVTALNRRSDLDLKKILKIAGIIANGNQYSTRRILEALKNALGVVVDIVCETDESAENYYLSEIHVCLDSYGKKLKDCQNQAFGCEDEPVFPYEDFQPRDSFIPPPSLPPPPPPTDPKKPPRRPPTPYWEHKNQTVGQHS